MIHIKNRSALISLFSLLILILFISCGKKERGPHTIKEFTGGFSRTFSDLNPDHLKAAKSINSTIFSSVEEIKDNGNMALIEENDYYNVDKLTHSHPYLHEDAADLLKTIGKNFQYSLESKSATPYRLIVTSVLRTQESIKGLRKRNSNSSLNSAHLYGTTFDIAYARFDKLDEDDTDIEPQLLKSVLAEVLRDLRKEKKCYVKYEVKQGCFHVTARTI